MNEVKNNAYINNINIKFKIEKVRNYKVSQYLSKKYTKIDQLSTL